MGFQTHARINAVVPYAESHLAMFKPPAILGMRSLGLAASLVVMLPYCRVRRRAVQPRGRRRFNIRFSRYPGRCPALMVSGATSDGRPSRGSCSRSVHSHPKASSCALASDATQSGWGPHIKDIKMSGVMDTQGGDEPHQYSGIGRSAPSSASHHSPGWSSQGSNGMQQLDGGQLLDLTGQNWELIPVRADISVHCWNWSRSVETLAIHLPEREIYSLAGALSRSREYRTRHKPAAHPWNGISFQPFFTCSSSGERGYGQVYSQSRSSHSSQHILLSEQRPRGSSQNASSMSRDCENCHRTDRQDDPGTPVLAQAAGFFPASCTGWRAPVDSRSMDLVPVMRDQLPQESFNTITRIAWPFSSGPEEQRAFRRALPLG